MNKAKLKEAVGKGIFAAAAAVCIIAVIAIFAFIIMKSLPALSEIGVTEFLFGRKWKPDTNDVYGEAISGVYGILNMIVGTVYATLGALLIGGVLGYFTAVFLAFFCPGRLKKLLTSVVNLLAGIPSVIYGFFGIKVVMPLLSDLSPTGNASGLFLTSVILGMMILPTVVSLTKTSLEAVPRSYYEGARALGATHEGAVFKTMIPAAKSGIVAALILGIGRALGETMAVVMISGNSLQIPDGLFEGFRTMTANIVLEMGYAGEVHMGALFATGGVLLIFVAIINLLLGLITSEKRKERSKSKTFSMPRLTGRISLGRAGNGIGKYASYIFAAFAGVFLVALIAYILIMGLPHINTRLLFGAYEYGGEISILPSIIATLMTVAVSLIVAIPLGVATAIFLNEYIKKGSKFVRLVRTAVDILSGVPSIVYGLFGAVTFVLLFGGSYSILAGSFTVSIMLLPTVIRSTEESLKAVPDSFREGSLALGAGKLRTIFKVVLPSAMPGIISAVILSMGRVVSESAPFMFTMGASIKPAPTGYLSGGTTLAVALYYLSGENLHTNEAYATACVLIIIVLVLNLLADFVGGRLSKKLKGNI